MKLKKILLGALFLTSIEASAATIYQAFEENFKAIEDKLPKLKQLGYSHIQISPPQKSLPLREWWARYQPLDHTIIEGLGTEDDLKHLVHATHQHGIKLLVDTVLNHMADPYFTSGQLTYREFDARDFHFPDSRPCITNYFDRFQVTHYWLCSGSGDRGLPDLDTGSPKVRATLLKFLEKLISLGVDGFRFDAMKHIEPEFWGYLIPYIKDRGLYYYGEVIGQTLEESALYTPFAEITDFHLLALMIRTFALGGDLRNLYDPIRDGWALSVPSIRFARNHDTAMHRDFYNFGDYTDAMLANAYILGRGEGVISIYRDDFEHPFVTSGIKFNNLTNGLDSRIIPLSQFCRAQDQCNPKTLMFLGRGDRHFMVINTSIHPIELSHFHSPSLQKGCYESLGTNKYFVTNDPNHSYLTSLNDTESNLPPTLGNSGPTIKVAARSAIFFAQKTSQICY